MSKLNYYTAEGLKKLKDELHEMKTVQRPSISNQIAEARDKGDLSENAEYDAAKEAQGLLETKISKLEIDLSNSRVLNKENLDSSSVHLLSTVVIQNIDSGQTMKYTIVSESEADLVAKKISVTSPIGKGLLGKSVGDIVKINVPKGILKFKVIDISIE